MKAAFTLTPAESRRLIAKGVVQMPEMRAALERAYVILPGSTANAFVAQELLGRDIVPTRYTAGIVTHRLLCVTNEEDRDSIPIILYKGEVVEKTIREALKLKPVRPDRRKGVPTEEVAAAKNPGRD